MNKVGKLICDIKDHQDLIYIRNANKELVALYCSRCRQQWSFTSLDDIVNIPVKWDIRASIVAAMRQGYIEFPDSVPV